MKKTFLSAVAIILGIAMGIFCFGSIEIYSVEGNSMLPTLEDGQRVLVYKLAYNRGKPCQGDLVLFPAKINSANGEGQHLLKRVVAKENDDVSMKAGKVRVNGKVLDEEYLFSKENLGDMAVIRINPNHIFVLGDNRALSLDSRDKVVGQVKVEDLEGRAIFRCWPLDKVGVIK